MSIDIDRLSENDLIDLNRRIVERQRFMQQARAHVAMLKFHIGGRVCFDSESHGTVTGTITRYNKRTVSLITDTGHRWNVAPGFLRSAITVTTTVVEAPKRLGG